MRITERIRKVAARGRSFTRHDIGTGRSVTCTLNKLVRNGELIRLQRGIPGMARVASVYQGIAERTTQQTTGRGGMCVKKKGTNAV